MLLKQNSGFLGYRQIDKWAHTAYLCTQCKQMFVCIHLDTHAALDRYECKYCKFDNLLQPHLFQQELSWTLRFYKLNKCIRLSQQVSSLKKWQAPSVSTPFLRKGLTCLPCRSQPCWWIAQLTFLLLKQLIANIKDMTGTKY